MYITQEKTLYFSFFYSFIFLFVQNVLPLHRFSKSTQKVWW